MGTLYKLGAIYKVLDKDVPRNKRRFRSTCVFLLKPDGKGGISKVKARTCLDGSRMVQGTHYHDKTSHMPQWQCVRTVVATCAARGRTLYQSDVPCAYLRSGDGDVETLHMEFPAGLGEYRTSTAISTYCACPATSTDVAMQALSMNKPSLAGCALVAKWGGRLYTITPRPGTLHARRGYP